ncbi:baseplate J/gp47 family protein [Paenibacillus gansuensis]|uniref:Baseplate J/gp47 family protein n=1 Tax=Paenibacillus gansuensis TaxID=306542 RepID=A0ABW5PHV0_9BACL
MGKDEILKTLLASVSDKVDKRPGSFAYDTLAPVAEQVADLLQEIETAKKERIIDNLSGDELTERVRERTGLTRKSATYAVGVVTLTGTGTIHVGDLFETEGEIQFEATETKNIVNTGAVNVRAVEAGSKGNIPAETITLFPVTLAGFTSVSNAAPTQDGFDEETDEDLIERYYERIRTPATSGNRAHYLNWAKEVPGVGGARVFPIWNGPNTVKVIVIDSDKKPASNAIVNAVQQYLDPGMTGLGDGQAPAGAVVTASSALAKVINVSFTLSLTPGYTLSQATGNITDSLTDFLKQIAFTENIVSYARIGQSILSSEGVADYSNLTINGGNVNIAISNTEVAVLGTVTISV